MGEVQGRPLTVAPAPAPPAPPAPQAKRAARRGRLWATLAAPGSMWLLAFLVVPFYSIAAVAFGYRDPLFGSPVPEWNPVYWDTTTFGEALRSTFTGDLRAVFIRTLVFVGVAL